MLKLRRDRPSSLATAIQPTPSSAMLRGVRGPIDKGKIPDGVVESVFVEMMDNQSARDGAVDIFPDYPRPQLPNIGLRDLNPCSRPLGPTLALPDPDGTNRAFIGRSSIWLEFGLRRSAGPALVFVPRHGPLGKGSRIGMKSLPFVIAVRAAETNSPGTLGVPLEDSATSFASPSSHRIPLSACIIALPGPRVNDRGRHDGEMARKRILQDAPLFNEVELSKV